MLPLQRSFTITLLAAYQRILSPMLHLATGRMGACRFQPTCSEYAVLAISTRGVFRGSWLALTRCLRCNPLCAGGFDPVPGTYPILTPEEISAELRPQ